MARKKSREDWKIQGNVFDQFTLRHLHYMENQGYFNELTHPLMVGKEANVFLGKKEDEYIVVKIYRLENCNFNKMWSYIITDPRFPNIRPQKRDVIFAWVLREYRNLLVARNTGCRVPVPIYNKANILLEEFIGEEFKPAPQLKDVFFESEAELQECYNEVLNQIKLLFREAKLVHADISEFNILYHEKKPVLIDFSQATSTKDFHAREYIERDLANVYRFFRKRGLEVQELDVNTEFVFEQEDIWK